eukprot:scaffold77688_cov39-Tisochrysis_lutea.AAC.2
MRGGKSCSRAQGSQSREALARIPLLIAAACAAVSPRKAPSPPLPHRRCSEALPYWQATLRPRRNSRAPLRAQPLRAQRRPRRKLSAVRVDRVVIGGRARKARPQEACRRGAGDPPRALRGAAPARQWHARRPRGASSALPSPEKVDKASSQPVVSPSSRRPAAVE